MKLLTGIWSILTPVQRRRVLLAQGLSLLIAISTVAGIAAIAPFFAVLGNPSLIDQTAALHRMYTALGSPGVRSFEITLGIAFMSLVFIANLINLVGTYYSSVLALRIGADLQSSLLGEYLARSYSFYAGAHRAYLANNVIHETARCANEVLQNLFALITSIITALLIVGSVMILNPVVATGLLVLLGGGYLAIFATVRRHLYTAGKAQSALFAAQAKLIDETFLAIKEILLLKVSEHFRSRFDRNSRQLARSGARIEFIAKSPRNIMECVAIIALVLTALMAGASGLGNRLGELTFIGFAMYRLLPILQQAFFSLVKVRNGEAAFEGILPDLHQARLRQQLSRALLVPRPPQQICLEQVAFSYDNQRAQTLQDISLQIDAHTALGIVGVNGSGKTTLVDLISGLLLPSSGVMRVGGEIIDDTNRDAWQSRIGYVPQSISILDCSIEENIALGVAPGDIDQRRLIHAARLAQLDQIVDLLPGGYKHQVGDRGVRLSGGQRQRIGIARALYRNCSLLIMDEATSAQDGLTERELTATLLKLRASHTIILIAHRLTSTRACDRIIELDSGRIIASGSYAELLEASVSFRHMAQAHESAACA